ncbi:MAG: substrate-binding domain-containing protein [Treponemataceae bacterium]
MSVDDVSTSKSARIYAWLRGEFEAERISAGDKLPSENELGLSFKASRPAVRQAVVRLIHEGLVETVRGVGSFRRKTLPAQSRDVALVLPSVTSYIYPELAEAANTAFRERGFNTLFDCTGGDSTVERAVLENLRARRPAGVVVSPIQRRFPDAEREADDPADLRGNLDLLKDLRAAGIFVVLLDNELGDDSFSSIIMDDIAGGAKAVDHLWSMGHRKIAVAWRPGHAPFEARRRGALDRLAVLGGTVGPAAELRVDGKGVERVEAAVARFIGVRPFPTAFFCANDELALSLAAALAKRGLRVPEDLSLLGFDDSPLARFGGQPLSSFAYPSRWIGRRAAELTAEALSGGTTTARTRICIDPVLVKRGSVRAPKAKRRSNS